MMKPPPRSASLSLPFALCADTKTNSQPDDHYTISRYHSLYSDPNLGQGAGGVRGKPTPPSHQPPLHLRPSPPASNQMDNDKTNGGSTPAAAGEAGSPSEASAATEGAAAESPSRRAVEKQTETEEYVNFGKLGGHSWRTKLERWRGMAWRGRLSCQRK